VFMGGKKYICAPWMAKQAEDFKYWYVKMRSLRCRVFVHGEGLIPDIWRAINAHVRERIAA